MASAGARGLFLQREGKASTQAGHRPRPSPQTRETANCSQWNRWRGAQEPAGKSQVDSFFSSGA